MHHQLGTRDKYQLTQTEVNESNISQNVLKGALRSHFEHIHVLTI